MKKYLSVILTLILVLSCNACGDDPQPTETTTQPTTQTEVTTQSTETTPEPSRGEIQEGDVNYLQMSISEADGSMLTLTAFDDDMGNAYIEYVTAQEKKLGNLDLSVLKGIQAELETSGMMDFAGREEYQDGGAFGSLYVSYTDETTVLAIFSGEIPKEFRDAYGKMEAYFKELTADIPAYIPEPVIMGEVNPDALVALEAILVASGAEPLDSFGISDIEMDDYFTAMMGLMETEGITSGTALAPLNYSVAFSCMLATVEEESKIATVAKDFADHVNWDRWMAVTATQGMVASKDKMVLCLVGDDDLYVQFANAIEACGWAVLEALTNQ